MEKIQIVYYTGTGSTRIIANAIYENLKTKNIECEINRLTSNDSDRISQKITSETNLILLYAVHAFNAPKLVYTWLDSLKEISGRKAMVISVSGGGEMISNTACRIPVNRRLKKKGFGIITEAMAVMPNNWMTPVPDEIGKALIRVVPQKVEKWVNAFIENKQLPYIKPLIIDHMITSLGRLETIGAKQFGKNIRVNDNCNACGYCVRNCPANNISFVDRELKPVFGSRCHFCLSCVYECPQKALSPGRLKFAVIPTGYPLKALSQNSETSLTRDELISLVKGKSWEGVRRYLEDI